MTVRNTKTRNRYRQLIQTCEVDLNWSLDTQTREAYVTALTPLLADISAERSTAIIANYHRDHASVLSLSDTTHPDHQRAWVEWAAQVLRILRGSGLAWSRDVALESDDLTQIALAELARALPSFRYQSRFSSWVYSVIIRCARRYHRDAQAQRRSGTTTPIEEADQATPLVDTHESPEQAANAQLLVERINAVLATHSDKRLLLIFTLWAVDDRSTTEIGTLIGLHESRVRALLKLARDLLRADPQLQSWMLERER